MSRPFCPFLPVQVPPQVPVRAFVESYFGFEHSFFVSFVLLRAAGRLGIQLVRLLA